MSMPSMKVKVKTVREVSSCMCRREEIGSHTLDVDKDNGTIRIEVGIVS